VDRRRRGVVDDQQPGHGVTVAPISVVHRGEIAPAPMSPPGGGRLKG
jgi:hypothetical protein